MRWGFKEGRGVGRKGFGEHNSWFKFLTIRGWGLEHVWDDGEGIVRGNSCCEGVGRTVWGLRVDYPVVVDVRALEGAGGLPLLVISSKLLSRTW